MPGLSLHADVTAVTKTGIGPVFMELCSPGLSHSVNVFKTFKVLTSMLIFFSIEKIM